MTHNRERISVTEKVMCPDQTVSLELYLRSIANTARSVASVLNSYRKAITCKLPRLKPCRKICGNLNYKNKTQLCFSINQFTFDLKYPSTRNEYADFLHAIVLH